MPSILGFHYYRVFVYDFSRASWVYLLKDHIDVMPSIYQLLQEIFTRYFKILKTLCTNNVLEFVQTAL